MRNLEELELEFKKLPPYLKVDEDNYQLIIIKQHFEDIAMKYAIAYVKNNFKYYNDGKCLFVVTGTELFETMNRFIDQFRELQYENFIIGFTWHGAILDYYHGTLTDCFNDKALNNKDFNKINKRK
jgi:hypothetical protein